MSGFIPKNLGTEQRGGLTSIPYEAPEHRRTAFNCPHCGAYSNQLWYDLYINRLGLGFEKVADLDLAYCAHCYQYSVWHQKRMSYPSSGTAPLPNPDLPDEIKADYDEARSIASLSPRGAAALLRLTIQKICKYLGEKGEHLNTDMANLVKKGLPQKVEKALDVVRVIGNNAVHPGQIDLKDNAKVAGDLFDLTNIIAEAMITQPKRIDRLYNGLPASQKEAIRKRDAQT